MNAQALTLQNQKPGGRVLEGELIQDATLSALDMSYMNFARLEFDRLDHLVRQFIVPALGSEKNTIASEIYRHLEQVRSFSGNFCWTHHAIGAAYDAKEVRP
ncbi:hypothetical protein D9M70_461570 [compost metagenome]